MVLADLYEALTAGGTVATAVFALAALAVAYRALKASQRSADAATAALQADSAPLVVLEDVTPGQGGRYCYLNVRNIGKGPALDLRVYAAPYMEQGIQALRTKFLSGQHLMPVAVDRVAQVRMIAVNGAEFDTPKAIELLVIYRDVTGAERYTHARPGVGPNALPTTTGTTLSAAAAEFKALCEAKAEEAAG